MLQKEIGHHLGKTVFPTTRKRRQGKLLFPLVSSWVASRVPEQRREEKRRPGWGSLQGTQAPFPLALFTFPATLGKSLALLASEILP